MTTSQRVPRRALLRRVGPWVVLAALLTGCASPAARTALLSLERECVGNRAPTTAACQTIEILSTGVPTTASLVSETMRAPMAVTGDADGGQAARTKKERRADARKRSSTPRAAIAKKQHGDPKPNRRRTTRRVPKVRMPAISSAYFGGAVTIARFRITGDTRSQILRSIRSRGPHGGAQGVTQPYLRYRFTFKYDRRGRCQVVRTGKSAVTMSFRVTLPSWAATAGTDQPTASWWADELRETAAHERRHVRLWRGAVRQANRIVATSSCGTVERRLNAVWRTTTLANCRFDASAYGISMRACLRR